MNSKVGKTPDCSDWYAEERERDEEEQCEPEQARGEQQVRRQPWMTMKERAHALAGEGEASLALLPEDSLPQGDVLVVLERRVVELLDLRERLLVREDDRVRRHFGIGLRELLLGALDRRDVADRRSEPRGDQPGRT